MASKGEAMRSTDWIARIIASVILVALAACSTRAPVAGSPDTRSTVAARAAPVIDRRIAITFDDVPWVMLRNAPPADLSAKHARLIASLRQADVPAIGFVNEGLLYAHDTLRPERVQM